MNELRLGPVNAFLLDKVTAVSSEKKSDDRLLAGIANIDISDEPDVVIANIINVLAREKDAQEQMEEGTVVHPVRAESRALLEEKIEGHSPRKIFSTLVRQWFKGRKPIEDSFELNIQIGYLKRIQTTLANLKQVGSTMAANAESLLLGDNGWVSEITESHGLHGIVRHVVDKAIRVAAATHN